SGAPYSPVGGTHRICSFFCFSFLSFLPSLFVFHLPPSRFSLFLLSFFLIHPISSLPLFLSFLPSLPVPRLGAHSCSRRMCAEIAHVGMPHPKPKTRIQTQHEIQVQRHLVDARLAAAQLHLFAARRARLGRVPL
ncbi:hypothetical protein B0H14DRAFT_2704446, partial [Mycena olivaceomarginata]